LPPDSMIIHRPRSLEPHRKKRSIPVLLNCLAAVSLPLAGCVDDAERMDRIVQAEVRNGSFIGAVLVARGDRVLFSRAYGMASLDDSLPNTTSTKFRIGSVTKQFTASAILLLEERGMLSLDDPVRQHWSDAPAEWDDITIFNLLTHTSGIPNFTSFPEYPSWKGQPAAIETIVGYFSDVPLNFRPGSDMSYSNSGYVLLGFLIERITGQSYADFLRENVLSPLGMNDSGYDPDMDLSDGAKGYVLAGGELVLAPYIDMTIPHAAGGLYSSVYDLLRWTQGLFGGDLLSAASMAKFITPFRNDYALGVEVKEVDGEIVIQHSGGIDGFTSHLSYYPERQITVVVLANLGTPVPAAIARDLGNVARGADRIAGNSRL
jgi:CubicO group peptidase (beta-lactamase class C family)